MFNAPQLPHLHTILDDLPHPHQMARYLDISTSTMNRYIRAGQAPRPVMLALFWETRWGVSLINCNAENAASLHACHASTLRQQNAKLHRIIAKLENERGQGLAANSPMFQVG